MKNPSASAEKVVNLQTAEITEATPADLRNHFYVTLNAISANINSNENREKIFEKSSLNKEIPIFLMILAAFAAVTVRPVLEYDDPLLLRFALIFPGGALGALFFILFGNTARTITVNGKRQTPFGRN